MFKSDCQNAESECGAQSRCIGPFWGGGVCLPAAHEKSTVADVVTVSLGLATQIPLEDSEGLPLLMAADEQLYRAKQHGRNRVMSACDKMN